MCCLQSLLGEETNHSPVAALCYWDQKHSQILQTVSAESLPLAMLAIELTAPFRSQTVGTIRALLQRLDVGTNDIADPADSGVAEDFVDTDFLLAKTILQSFYCDIDSDFVPKFETVGDSLRD
jgi:hypothetical protein